ncbi:9160_t:CDS:2 [Paraglomus occultum]|uniref:LSM complex subunit LSM4 n=1 Tax=Paraglomus occultum TaxID=144539 RepID=A0A9N9G8F7_9GLOM|nr:9160_t:CDS:2 [Paraglomus occultum]
MVLLITGKVSSDVSKRYREGEIFSDPKNDRRLPLSLLTTAQGHPMLVELKNGETFNGHLVNCDNWMNLTLREVIQTSPEGDRFWRLSECYIRGNTIKYLRVPDEIIEMVREDAARRQASGGGRGRGGQRGHTSGRGGGRGSSGRGGRGGMRGGGDRSRRSG